MNARNNKGDPSQIAPVTTPTEETIPESSAEVKLNRLGRGLTEVCRLMDTSELEAEYAHQPRIDQSLITLMKAGRFVPANKEAVKAAFDKYVDHFRTVVFPRGSKFTSLNDCRSVGDIVDELIRLFKQDLNWDISTFPPARIILTNLFWDGVNKGRFPEYEAEQDDFDAMDGGY
jgi:hypothetical protein